MTHGPTSATSAWRVAAFVAVAACFFIQAGFVWTDAGAHPGSTAPISPLARAGQTIFRTHGCQSCHQLFGMGGFLGPDLTNAARRVPPARFAELLANGNGIMPAYRLDAHQQQALSAYLEAVNATGQGTPPSLPDPGPLFGAALERWRALGNTVPTEVAEGAAFVAAGPCVRCHRSFAVDSAIRAPDLSLAVGHLGETGVRQVLANGRGAMPVLGLNAHQADVVVAFLAWLSAHRDELAPRRKGLFAGLTWFAYAQPAAPPIPTAPTP